MKKYLLVTVFGACVCHNLTAEEVPETVPTAYAELLGATPDELMARLAEIGAMSRDDFILNVEEAADIVEQLFSLITPGQGGKTKMAQARQLTPGVTEAIEQFTNAAQSKI